MHEKKLVEGKAAGIVSPGGDGNADAECKHEADSCCPALSAGKQVVYHAIQDPADEASPEQLAEIDQEIERLKEEIASTKAQEKELKVELATLSARVPTAELHNQVRSLGARKEELIDQLTPLRNASGSARMVPVEEQRRVDEAWKKWQRTAAARKRICRDLWEKCTEVLPEDVSNRQELWESLGLDGELRC